MLVHVTYHYSTWFDHKGDISVCILICWRELNRTCQRGQWKSILALLLVPCTFRRYTLGGMGRFLGWKQGLIGLPDSQKFKCIFPWKFPLTCTFESFPGLHHTSLHYSRQVDRPNRFHQEFLRKINFKISKLSKSKDRKQGQICIKSKK